jgi:hypothetical protein
MAGFPPKKGGAFIWYFFIRDADGDLVTGATALDVESSGDGAAFGDVAGTEVDEGEGLYSCPISTGEMNFDVVALICKTSTADAKTAAQVIYTSTRQLDDLAFPTSSGNSIDVTATGAVGIDWANVESQATAVDLSATDFQLVDTTTTNTDMVGTDSALLAASAPTNFGDLSITVTTGLVDVTQTAADKVWGTATRALTDKVGFTALLEDGASGGTSAVLTLERLIIASATATEPAVKLTGNTSGAGLVSTGGVTGAGISAVGGATSGAAVLTTVVSGNKFDGDLSGSVGSVVGHTAQTGDSFAIVNSGTFGNAQLVRSTTPANTLDVNATGEAGLDLDNTSGTIAAAQIATDAITAAKLASDVAVEIRDAILPVQNVALSNIEFLWVAASDHVTPVTGASTTSVNRSIDGGAFGAGTGTLAEVGNGIYQYDASQADMNGGIITFRFSATGGTPGAPDDAFVTIVTGAGV